MSVLVLAVGIVAGALAMILPATDAAAMRVQDCWGSGWVTDADGRLVRVEDRYLC